LKILKLSILVTRGAKDHIALWSVDNLNTPASKRKSKKITENDTNVQPKIISKLKWEHYVECVRFSVINDEGNKA